METSTIVAIATVCGSAIGFLSFWLTLSGRISSADAKADAAGKQAATATARAIALEKELTDHRVAVAREYVSNGTLASLENRIVDAINRLGDRFDKLLAATH